jgi:hypothetical protein
MANPSTGAKGRAVVNRYFAGWGKAGIDGSSVDPTLRQTPDFLSIMATSTNSMRLSLKPHTWSQLVPPTRRFVTQRAYNARVVREFVFNKVTNSRRDWWHLWCG